MDITLASKCIHSARTTPVSDWYICAVIVNFLCIYGCPPSNCLFGIRQIHFIAIIIIIIIISDIINTNIVNKRLCSLVIVI